MSFRTHFADNQEDYYSALRNLGFKLDHKTTSRSKNEDFRDLLFSVVYKKPNISVQLAKVNRCRVCFEGAVPFEFNNVAEMIDLIENPPFKIQNLGRKRLGFRISGTAYFDLLIRELPMTTEKALRIVGWERDQDTGGESISWISEFGAEPFTKNGFIAAWNWTLKELINNPAVSRIAIEKCETNIPLSTPKNVFNKTE